MTHPFALLCLLSVPALGPIRIRHLIATFGSASAVLRAPARQLHRLGGIELKLAQMIADCRRSSFALEQLRRARETGTRIFTFWEETYPALLKSIHDPPLLLYVRGKLPERMNLAVVGTRQPSPYGQMVAALLSRELASRGFCVVSGLARGIDTIAHLAALEAGGKTVAVIGAGIDRAYPPENADLMRGVAERGAVVSEFPFGSPPSAGHFPRRNRIISGLSRGCIIVESDLRGGAMITASFALDQNRELFAVPGNITERKSAGVHALIRDGRAKLVHTVDDILSKLPEIHPPEKTNAVSSGGDGIPSSA